MQYLTVVLIIASQNLGFCYKYKEGIISKIADNPV